MLTLPRILHSDGVIAKHPLLKIPLENLSASVHPASVYFPLQCPQPAAPSQSLPPQGRLCPRLQTALPNGMLRPSPASAGASPSGGVLQDEAAAHRGPRPGTCLRLCWQQPSPGSARRGPASLRGAAQCFHFGRTRGARGKAGAPTRSSSTLSRCFPTRETPSLDVCESKGKPHFC